MLNKTQSSTALRNAWLLALGAACMSGTTYAQDQLNSDTETIPATWDEEEDLYRLRVGIQQWFNTKLSYGATGPDNDPGPASSGSDHYYDDGYNLLDVTGNGGDLTSYWGYDNASQLTDEYFGGGIPGNIDFHSGSVANDLSEDVDSDLSYEIELSRKLDEFGEEGHWGISLSLSYFTLDHEGAGPFDFDVITDSYDHYLDPFPSAGHQGGFNDSTNLITDTPTRSTSVAAGSGSREFDADIWSIRLGPYVDTPLTDSLWLEAGAGLAALYVDGEFSYSDSYSFAGETFDSAGGGDQTELLFGGYIGATLTWQLDEQLGIYGGANWIAVEPFEAKANTRFAELDFSKGLVFRFGISYWFD